MPDTGRDQGFATTRWTLVLAAGQGTPSQARDALATLCGAYWYPLYAYARRQGHRPEDARDLTQEFFARLLAGDDLAKVRRDKGRFRSFLLAAMKHFLINEWKRARRLKRGGGQPVVSLDARDAETRYTAEPAHQLTAERIYERRWALTVLEQTVARLRDEYAATGRTRLFESLKGHLTGDDGEGTCAQLGESLGRSEAAVKMALSRLRRRYRELLRAEIADTVATSEEVEDELRYLFTALS